MNSLNPLRFTSHKKNWEKCLLFQSWNDCLLNWAKWQLFSLKIVLGCHLSEKWCRFVNLLSFASSYFFLSLRKIMWPNSQDFLLRTQNEALSPESKKTTSFFSPKDTHGINTARTVEVWMDDYKRLYYMHRQDLEVI